MIGVVVGCFAGATLGFLLAGLLRGGRTEWENVVAACGPCNRRKGNKTPDEASMKMMTHPHRPRFWAMALLTMSNNETWRKYLRSVDR